MKLLLTILWFCSVKAVYDAWRIKKGIGVNHPVEWLMLAGAFVAADYLLELRYTALLVQCIGSWLYFDALLNVLRKRPLFYVGKTAGIDVFFSGFRHPELTMLLTKIVLLLIVLYAYIIL
jgi:hypothetical protein